MLPKKRGVDLWNYETTDGRSIKKALDFLIPFVIDGKPWNYPQIHEFKTRDFYTLLVQATIKFKDKNYRIAANKIKDSNKNILVKLFYE